MSKPTQLTLALVFVAGTMIGCSSPAGDAALDTPTEVSESSTHPPDMLGLSKITVTKLGNNDGEIVADGHIFPCVGKVCSASFSTSRVVSVGASPHVGSDNVPDATFTGWGPKGAPCSGLNDCHVDMDENAAARTLTATFESDHVEVKTITGGGTVFAGVIKCDSKDITPQGSGPGCSGNFQLGFHVVLLATAHQGYVFEGWGDDCIFKDKHHNCEIMLKGNGSTAHVAAFFSKL